MPAVYIRKRRPVARSAQTLDSPHHGGLLNKTFKLHLLQRPGIKSAKRRIKALLWRLMVNVGLMSGRGLESLLTMQAENRRKSFQPAAAEPVSARLRTLSEIAPDKIAIAL
jgi:hypothetical protein